MAQARDGRAASLPRLLAARSIQGAGHPWLLALLAGRIPALAAGVVFSALAARIPVVLKPSSAEPVFARLLVKALEAAAPDLASAVTVADLPSRHPSLSALAAAAPVALVYGSDSTVAAVLALRPDLPTLTGPHRESAAIVFRDALGLDSFRRLAAALARDISIYDQSGCLSPQVVLVEEGGDVSPMEFAATVLESLRAIERRWPPGPMPLDAAASMRLLVQEARMPAASSGPRAFPATGQIPPLVIFSPGIPYRPGPGFRTIQVIAFRDAPDLPRLLAPLEGRLQGIAVSGDRRRLNAVLSASPRFRPHRICAPGRLQSPPADWPENGIVLARELARLG
jgi:hypothetical protein